MRVELVLEVEDDELVDADHAMGITEDAYMALSNALADAGFGIANGPNAQVGS